MNIQAIIDFFSFDENTKVWNEIKNLNLANINEIRKIVDKFPEHPVKDLLSLRKIQSKNSLKFFNVEKLLITERSSQQASSSVIAQYHGDLFSKFKTVADLCCGSGIDLISLSKNKVLVYAVDLDKTVLLTAEFNTQLFSSRKIIFQNIKAEDFSEQVEAIFIDPDRRMKGNRFINAEDLSPNLESILELQKKYKNLAIKFSPAMNYDRLKLPENHTFEFVSESGNLKEILLCFGNLTTKNVKRKAVLLPEKKILCNKENLLLSISEIKQYLFEPDPAIIRAHLLKEIAQIIGFQLFDSHLALLTGDYSAFSVYGKFFKVITYFNFNIKKLKKYLKGNAIGKLTIKTRGYSESVESFRKKLKLKGKNSSILFILRIGKGHIFLFAKRA